MIKLELFRKDDEITIVAVYCPERITFLRKEKGDCAVGYARPGWIGLNRDYLKELWWFLHFPQVFLHEVLHYLTRFDMDCGFLIHRVHSWAWGLIC